MQLPDLLGLDLLVIDDDEISRELLALQLSLLGHSVATAEDGDAVLSLMETHSLTPSVILMDAQMPGLSGLALIEALRPLTTAQIVLISGSTPDDELIAGADAFLLKPCSDQDLRSVLDRLMHANVVTNGQSSDENPPTLAAKTTARRGWGTHDSVSDSASESGLAISPSNQATLELDPQKFAQLRAMMPESAIREILAALATDLEKRIAALRVAIKGQQWQESRSIGHAIKGGAAMIGATRLRTLGSEIEEGLLDNASTGNQMGTDPPAIIELTYSLATLRRMLESDF